MVVAVMQPTYLPWTGYFDLIDQSDVFVFLDTVAFSKQSWQQRNRIKTPQGFLWLTVPVLQRLNQRVIDVRIDCRANWRQKHWSTLRHNYSRTAFWSGYEAVLKDIYAHEWDSLAELNKRLVAELCRMLGVEAHLISASELPEIEETKVERLVAMCEHLGATTYLSPAGSFDYLQSDDLFRSRGIELVFQNYEHPVYAQAYGEFRPYLSVVDLLMSVGPSSAKVMRSGRRRWRSVDEMRTVCSGWGAVSDGGQLVPSTH